jgi:hypothetical protein
MKNLDVLRIPKKRMLENGYQEKTLLATEVSCLHEHKANGHTHGYPISEPLERGMPVV